MPPVISTELLRRVRNEPPPSRLTDYRDAKVPGFVLRARPSGVHSWPVQLPNRRWLTLGRVIEVALADAREAAQQRRAKAALGQEIQTRKATSEATLRAFLTEQYEPWMKATHRGRAGQVERIRSAFPDLLDLNLSELTSGRVERWRAARRNKIATGLGRGSRRAPRGVSDDNRSRHRRPSLRALPCRGMGIAVGESSRAREAKLRRRQRRHSVPCHEKRKPG